MSDPYRDYLLVRESVNEKGQQTHHIRHCETLEEAQRQLEAVTAAKNAARRNGDKERLWEAELDERKACAEMQRHQPPVYLDIGGDIGAGRGNWQATRGRSYREMFDTPSTDMADFSDPSEFFRTVVQNPGDPRLLDLRREHRGMSEAIPADGAFSVPTELSAWLIDNSFGSELVRPRADVWPMVSKTREVPAWNDSDRSTSLLGGFSAEWAAEGTSLTASHPKLRNISLTARKLALYSGVSNELLDDGLQFREKFLTALSAAIGWSLDSAFISGSGAGQPLGLRSDPAKVSVTAETGQSPDTIVFENVAKMLARLAPECMDNAIWIASQTTIPQLAGMSIDIGTSGAHIPALRDDDGSWRLLTRPVFFTEHLPTLGDADDLMLVDLSRYIVGLRSEVRIDVSPHIGFQEDETFFRAIIRADGQGAWQSARTPAHGDSVSWIVSLAERA